MQRTLNGAAGATPATGPTRGVMRGSAIRVSEALPTLPVRVLASEAGGPVGLPAALAAKAETAELAAALQQQQQQQQQQGCDYANPQFFSEIKVLMGRLLKSF